MSMATTVALKVSRVAIDHYIIYLYKGGTWVRFSVDTFNMGEMKVASEKPDCAS